MVNRFSPGDLVRIKNYEKCDRRRVGINSQMKYLCGTTAVVLGTASNGYAVYLHQSELDDDHEIRRWIFDVNWLEHLDDESCPDDVDPDILLAIL